MKQTLMYILGLSLLIAGCGTEHDIQANQTPAAGARLKFIHAVVDGPAVNIFANDAKVNGTSLTYGTTFPTEYAALPAGAITLRVATVASGTVASATILSAPVTVEADKYYSIVATGIASNTTTPPAALLLTDDLDVPDPTKNYIRVVNLVTNGPALDLAIGTGTPLLTNIARNTASGYVAVEQNAATAPYAFQVRSTGTTTQIGSTLNFNNLVRGRKYTIVVRGVVGRTGAAAPTLAQYTVR
jgi:hypothetical protein